HLPSPLSLHDALPISQCPSGGRTGTDMRDFSADHGWLSVNTATLRRQHGAEVPLAKIIDQCAAQGVRAISPWRDQVAAAGLDAVDRKSTRLNSSHVKI